MNEQNHHQAEQLEKMIQEVKNHSEFPEDDSQESQQLFQPEINILNLPPRREVHQKDDRRFKFKMSKASRRLFLIIIILLILVSVVVYDFIHGNRLFKFNTNYLTFDKHMNAINFSNNVIKEYALYIIDYYIGGL